jgi:hypothetical protein
MPLPFTVECAGGWRDVTRELEVTDPPWTLARPDGVGVFQFSVAHYQRGAVPNASSDVLLSLLRDFASSHELGEPTDVAAEAGELRIAAGSFRQRDSFIRAWYISDGRSFARITYTCAFGRQQAELSECEQMVRTVRFRNETVV